jgi:hypothetical protein
MSSTSNAARWWENYLVRYLMPSIAGIAIVQWLVAINPELYSILFFGAEKTGLTSAKLLLLLLYGNLFCYIASYPILGFHATRMLDFSSNNAQQLIPIPYIITGVVAFIVSLLAIFQSIFPHVFFPVACVVFFSSFQMWRVVASMNTKEGSKKSPAFKYLWQLSRRRGIQGKEASLEETIDENEVKKIATKQINARPEFIETYRHMREHGNSSFIFVLELILACLCYCTVKSAANAETTIAMLALVLAVWSLPAVFVHLLGQKLEREFSKFEETD